jgi:uncharacterized protein YndB with AHSA1/START domain
MAEVVRYVRLPIDEVFDAVSDPTTYPHWLVGAREIRSVEAAWPAPGTCFHHRVGLAGPLTVADSTEVVEVEAPRRLVLDARARPFGRARVRFDLAEEPDAGGDVITRVSIHEVPAGALAPLTPLLDPPTAARNRVSLNALVAYLNQPDARRGSPDSAP